MPTITKRRKAVKKTTAAKKEVFQDPNEITTKTIRSVSTSDKLKFQELAEQNQLTEGEMFSLLIDKFSTYPLVTGGATPEEIAEMEHKISALQGQVSGLSESNQLLTTRVQDLQALNNEYATKLNSGSAEDLAAAQQVISDLNEKLKTYEASGLALHELAETVSNYIQESGFENFDAFIEDYKGLQEKVSLLTDELTAEKENGVKLEGNEFIAKISERNFKLASKYRSSLFNNKLISGSNEEYPNELINWAIPAALRFTFAKLPEV